MFSRLPDPSKRVAFGVDEPAYFSVHTRPDAPIDQPVIAHAMWSNVVERAVLESWMDRVQRGWRDVVVEARYLSHMTVSTVPIAGVARPETRLPNERCFLVGDYVDSGHIRADGAAASAVAAAHAIGARTTKKAA